MSRGRCGASSAATRSIAAIRATSTALDLRKRLGRNPDPDEGYKLVTDTMQRSLTQLGSNRKVPVLG
jgi:hypothetical protein